jgi:hypothetical protein
LQLNFASSDLFSSVKMAHAYTTLNVIWSELCKVLMSDKYLYVWERLQHHNYIHKEFQMKVILDRACYHGVQRRVS